MNDFISKERSHMETFIDKVSSPVRTGMPVYNTAIQNTSSGYANNIIIIQGRGVASSLHMLPVKTSPPGLGRPFFVVTA